MSEKKLGLGRGLSALLEEIGGSGNAPAATAPRASSQPNWVFLPIYKIVANPAQPRRHFNEEALVELTESIRARGMLQPILVRPSSAGNYEVVAGERRWRAAQAVPLHEVPVVIRDLDDTATFEIALIENVQRADLNPVEEAEGYRRLIDQYGHTQESVAKVTGKSRSHIANLLRLLKLPDSVLGYVHDGQLSMGHARTLIGRDDALELADLIVRKDLSVREAEALVADEKGGARRSRPRPATRGVKDPDTEALERALSDSLGLKVSIDGIGQSGRVVIDYGTLDQLDLLAQRLSGGRF